MSFEEFCKSYSSMVYRMAYLYTGDSFMAEDIRQEVFISANKHFSKIHSPKSWLIRTTINHCKNYLRKKSRHPETELLGESALVDETNEPIHLEIDVVEAALKLPLKYKEVIILYYYQQFTSVEIAEELNLPNATIRTRLFRGRNAIKKYLEGRGK